MLVVVFPAAVSMFLKLLTTALPRMPTMEVMPWKIKVVMIMMLMALRQKL